MKREWTYDVSTQYQHLYWLYQPPKSFNLSAFSIRILDDVCICDVVKFKLCYGAYKGSRTTENLQILDNFFSDVTSLPFGIKAAQICGQIRAKLQVKGTLIGADDIQIAAIALANNLSSCHP